jgi:hypothetical protein
MEAAPQVFMRSSFVTCTFCAFSASSKVNACGRQGMLKDFHRSWFGSIRLAAIDGTQQPMRVRLVGDENCVVRRLAYTVLRSFSV